MAKRKKFNINTFWVTCVSVETALLLLIGLASFVFGILYDPSNAIFGDAFVNSVFPLVLGGFVVIDSLLRIAKALVGEDKKSDLAGLVIGVFEFTIGAVAVLNFAIIMGLLIDVFSVLLCVLGVSFIVAASFAIARRNEKTFLIIEEMVSGILSLGLGIAMIVLYKGHAADNSKFLLIFTGILFVAIGTFFCFNVVKNAKRMKAEGKFIPVYEEVEEGEPKKKKKKKSSKAIEADSEEVEVIDAPQIEAPKEEAPVEEAPAEEAPVEEAEETPSETEE